MSTGEPSNSRAARVEISLAAIRHNLAVAKNLAGSAKILACVKADAYGHGAIQVARAIADEVDALGVACLDEALQLRQAGIQRRIVLLSGCHQKGDLAIASRAGMDICIHTQWQLDDLLASKLAEPVCVWLKLDTGMHRLGLPMPQAEAAYAKLTASKNCRSVIAMTHFASADEPEHWLTEAQSSLLQDFSKTLGCERSSANSAALLRGIGADLEWVRPGLMLYGNSPFAGETPGQRQLKPAMRMVAEVLSMQRVPAGDGVGYNHKWIAPGEALIAIVGAGYGDGYPQSMPNGAPVLVRGEVARTVGKVSMDLMAIDVSDISGVAVGDEVELWGPELPLCNLVTHSGFSAYELTTRIPVRPRRVYLD